MIKTIFFFVISITILQAQPNCNAFKYYGDTLKCRACEWLEKAKDHYQFSKTFQEIHDQSIAIDSTFAYAYREKSVAYLKSGDFITWKKLIDKAVELDPMGNLAARASCRYQFFNDYQGAIKDIEHLEKIADYDIGHSSNGDYHLIVSKALCYRALGDSKKALDIIENYLYTEERAAGIYDYIHLGVLYMEYGNYQEALKAFEQQKNWNDVAENHYYAAMVLKKMGALEESQQELEKAKELYLEERRMFNAYTHYADKIYLDDIEQGLVEGD